MTFRESFLSRKFLVIRYPCTPPSSVETFSGKISASIGSSKEMAGLNKKKKNIIMMMMTRNS